MIPTRLRRVARGFLVSLLVLVVACVAAELGLRAWSWISGQAYDPALVEERLLSLESPIRRFMPGGQTGIRPRPVLNPYWGSEDEPDSGGVLAYFREEWRPDDFTVLVSGGSVATTFALTESAEICAAIQQDPRFAGRRVVLVHAAHPAFKQPMLLNRLTLLLVMGCRVDAVVAIDGFNEVSGALDNLRDGRHPAWPNAPNWTAALPGGMASSPECAQALAGLYEVRESALGIVETWLKHGLHRSAVLGKLAVARLAALGRRRAELQAIVSRVGSRSPERELRESAGPPWSGSEDEALRLGVRIWRECSLAMDQLCDARGIAYLHVLQPALPDSGTKPLSEHELAITDPRREWTVAVRDGYPLLRAAGAELAAAGVHFLDATGVFANVPETMYSDFCHFSDAGNDMLRELIVPHFLGRVVPP